MTAQIRIKTRDGKFSRFKKGTGGLCGHAGMEVIRPLPADLGQGGFYNLACREGLNLCLNRTRFKRDYHARITWPSPKVTFAYCLTGRTRTLNDCCKFPMEMAAGDAFVYYFKDPYVEQQVKGGRTVKGLAAHFSPKTLLRLASPFAGRGSGSEEDLKKALDMGELFISRPMTPRMIRLLKEVLTCPHRGMFKKLFLESRALELAACLLEQAFCRESPGISARPLSPDDRDRISHVRDILVSRLRFPPALPDLADAAGMSHTRLNRGFKKLYGCTVFEYLRNERLNYGRILLDEHRLSITQTAFEAGFSSSSHFAAAFQKAYGVSPSAYRRESPFKANMDHHNTCCK